MLYTVPTTDQLSKFRLEVTNVLAVALATSPIRTTSCRVSVFSNRE